MAQQQFISPQQITRITNYLNDSMPIMISAKVLRFIDGNFRAGGWQGDTFTRWTPNKQGTTTLVKTGALKRSFNARQQTGGIYFYSNMPYGWANNRGFDGTVKVKAHSRARYTRSRETTGQTNANGQPKKRTVMRKTGTIKVRGYSKKVKIEQRQFAPYDGHESKILNKSIEREVIKEIKKIIEP